MEDYELQEIEFWRKLEEESMSRRAMLRRSAAAAVGLTVLSSPAAAWAARARQGEIDGVPASGRGRGTSVLKRVNGEWRIVHENLSQGRWRPPAAAT